MKKKDKIRLDTLMVNKGVSPSRERAKKMIMAGIVLVDNVRIDKAGTLVDALSKVTLKGEDIPYVSRGGLKLEKALDAAGVDLTGLTALDIGASTGGFTDCLLQHGVSKVYSVDVGYGQFDWRLRQDERVVVMERTNIRHMPYERVGEKVDLVVIDTSFISLKIVIPAAEKFMKKGTGVYALIKPQFEAGRDRVEKGGVVKDENIVKTVIDDIKVFCQKRGYDAESVILSPVLGPKGNREYIISLKYMLEND
ncbi:MAG: TlyA family RNA methyltransferase [Thermodesulfobacteriota bacterium]